MLRSIQTPSRFAILCGCVVTAWVRRRLHREQLCRTAVGHVGRTFTILLACSETTEHRRFDKILKHLCT